MNGFTDPLQDTPNTIPARMINEFVYCPRLFYLEWVQSQFATSDDIEQGNYVHRVVDESRGILPTGDKPHLEPYAGRTFRSIWLTSQSLGVSAKIDLVEISESGSLVPVDYKKGKPTPDGHPWPSDTAQSLIHALLLSEAGYSVDHAEIWYAETRQRLIVTIDEASTNEIQELVAAARSVTASDVAPPPLIDSPKCPLCSLVGICLPDEINALQHRHRNNNALRRIIPADPDTGPVYIQEQGSVVTTRSGRLDVIKDGAKLASFRLIDVSQVCLQGNISITAQAMRELMARDIPVCWFSFGGWFSGIAHGLPGKNIDLRRAQFSAPPERCLSLARQMIEAKIRNSRTLLRRNDRTEDNQVIDLLHQLAKQASTAPGFPTLLGIEGTAARVYFGRFTHMFSSATDIPISHFDVNGRTRRPPPDPINALLSYTYALLAKDITVILFAIGFDPYLGIYHRPRFGRPALALDLAEEFRPLVAESVVLQVVNNGEVKANDFTLRAGGCQLDERGCRAVLHAYERRMNHEIKHPVFRYRVNYRRAIEIQGRLLGAYLLGEIDEYTPFTTR